eukprot:gb/GECG01001625.1/.p1 GENE.gb/GECG01001625.1/~~gb/GECG01001625.1/.p1  ORF type:complete len:883 (+),score=116.30 gb/GECG01001625.1/:1-2649(+)
MVETPNSVRVMLHRHCGSVFSNCIRRTPSVWFNNTRKAHFLPLSWLYRSMSTQKKGSAKATKEELLVCPSKYSRFAALECTATVAHCELSHPPVKVVSDASEFPLGSLIGLRTSDLDESIYGHHAVSLFKALNGGKKGAELYPDNLRVDGWLQFLSNQLEPALLEAKTSHSAGLEQNIQDCLLRIDEAISANKQGGGKAIVGVSLSLADIAIASQLKEVQSLQLADFKGYRSLPTYFNHIAQLPEFKTGLKEVERIEKVLNEAPENVDLTNVLHPEDYTSSLLESLKLVFTAALHEAFPAAKEADIETADIELNSNTKMQHNYQCNSALSVFGKLKSVEGALPSDCKNPRSVAQKLLEKASKLTESKGVIDKLELSGPGFINIYLSPDYLSKRVGHICGSGLQPPRTKRSRVAIDYSSPNIAKEMHVGHLRSTIIGDAMARILEYLGHEVQRFNHVGDWGTQFGMLIAHMKDRYPDADKNPPDIENLSKFYKDAKKRFDEEEGFKERSQKEVVKLQRGDEKNLEMWRALCRISESMFSQVYKRLGISDDLQIYGESFYNSMLQSVVEEFERKNLITISDGAKTVFVDDAEVPLMLQKRDGGYGYDSTDLAAIKYRLFEKECDWLIYVVDSGQQLHFDLVFKAAGKAGWIDRNVHRVEHTGFGVVQGQDRKKFKSRSGDTVRLVDLLDEARSRMYRQLKERNEQGNSQLPEEELEYAAECLGYGGVKYFDLRQNRLSDYIFDYDRMLSAEGDTAVYMQYAHARMQSIIRKLQDSGHNVNQLVQQGEKDPVGYIKLDHPSERALAEELCKWADMCKAFEKNLLPNILTGYIYELAGKFTDFYRDCKLLGSDEKTLTGRLILVKSTAETVATVLRLLGIEPLSRL